MIWTAGFRTEVIGPYGQLHFNEHRGFADQTVRQVPYRELAIREPSH
ncbi:hypothetical protein C8E86_5683 [Catellatospora citrea]|nr:hypothetical protein C8E86_5683 [Catellatospora citrea]